MEFLEKLFPDFFSSTHARDSAAAIALQVIITTCCITSMSSVQVCGSPLGMFPGYRD